MPNAPLGYLFPANGGGHGLTGEYFDNTMFNGAPIVAKVDHGVNFWGVNFGNDIPTPPALMRSVGAASWSHRDRDVLLSR